jgi:hypothetical protein
VATLSNTEWRKICAAAERKPNAEVEARATLSKILFEDYPGFKYDHRLVAMAAKRAERMLEHLDAFAAGYRAQFNPADDAVRTSDVKIRIKPDLWCLEGLRRETQNVLDVAGTLQKANDRRHDVRRAMLYHWLCNAWLDYFEGGPELPPPGWGLPPLGPLPPGPELPPPGPARTPLVNFMLAAMRLIMPSRDLPKPDTVRENIDRERRERALKLLRLRLFCAVARLRQWRERTGG